jgi:hypothetical protein
MPVRTVWSDLKANVVVKVENCIFQVAKFFLSLETRSPSSSGLHSLELLKSTYILCDGLNVAIVAALLSLLFVRAS